MKNKMQLNEASIDLQSYSLSMLFSLFFSFADKVSYSCCCLSYFMFVECGKEEEEAIVMLLLLLFKK